MNPKTSPGPAAWRESFAPKALLVFLAGMTVLVAIVHLVSLRADRVRVEHSEVVIEATQALFSDARDVESQQRGYLATRDAQFLKDYDAARPRLPAASARLTALVAADATEARAVARLTDLLNQRITLSDQRVRLARDGHLDQALAIQVGGGRRLMASAQAVGDQLIQSEQAEVVGRGRQADRNDLLVFFVVLGLSALSILGLALMMGSMSRANRRLQHEIGERRAAEAARRDGEALYRAIFETTADLLYVLEVQPNGQFHILEGNPAYERAVGALMEQFRGVDICHLVNEQQRPILLAHLNSVVEASQPVFSRDQVLLPVGERIWESVLTPLRNAEGRVVRIAGASRDVTDREHAQDQLRRVQRMETIGHLTGGVAHDFNNLLQVIRGNLELISAQLGDGPVGLRIRNALTAAERAAQLTRQLLAFARRQPLDPRIVHLGRLITDMTPALTRAVGDKIKVEIAAEEDLWNTLADPAQLETALLNLVLNARDAMPEGGHLKVEVRNAVLDEAFARRDSDFEPGQYVLVAVSDTGAGMDREILSRAFEPFFTTKSEEKGTGLGLSMVYGFVKQSSGHVEIVSEPGQGAKVRIYLPRSRQDEPTEVVALEPIPPGRSEVILVVEDDDMVRSSVVAVLRALGYGCLHAADGAAALEILKSGARVDLLFTDVIMPGPVKSRDLAREAQALRPDLPILYTSGYSEDVIVHHGRLDEGVQLLSKPYTREDLARKIGGLLRRHKPVVLVVEDDPLVRMATVDMVEALGFTVLQAGDAPEALSLLGQADPIDVLFTDVGLPGVRGPELAARARGMRPDLKVIFASGYSDVAETSPIPGATHLRKPYEQEELAEALGVG